MGQGFPAGQPCRGAPEAIHIRNPGGSPDLPPAGAEGGGKITVRKEATMRWIEAPWDAVEVICPYCGIPSRLVLLDLGEDGLVLPGCLHAVTYDYDPNHPERPWRVGFAFPGTNGG